MITLYGYPTSPYVQKIKCVLLYKGLDHAFAGVTPGSKKELAFTGDVKNATVPVVMIDEEWRMDSTPIAHWLDERFPERPVTGRDEQDKVKVNQDDSWVTHNLIPHAFRSARDWSRPFEAFPNAWRLAAVVNDATPLPFAWRLMWPLALKQAGFIDRILEASSLDLTLSVRDGAKMVADEFIRRLRGGPYMNGRDEPSLADLAAYAPLSFKKRCGFKAAGATFEEPEIRDWRTRMEAHLPANPFPVSDRFLKD